MCKILVHKSQVYALLKYSKMTSFTHVPNIHINPVLSFYEVDKNEPPLDVGEFFLFFFFLFGGIMWWALPPGQRAFPAIVGILPVGLAISKVHEEKLWWNTTSTLFLLRGCSVGTWKVGDGGREGKKNSLESIPRPLALVSRWQNNLVLNTLVQSPDVL